MELLVFFKFFKNDKVVSLLSYQSLKIDVYFMCVYGMFKYLVIF